MLEVLLAYGGYAWGALHDLAALRNVPRLKPFLLLMSVTSHGAAWYRLSRYSSRIQVAAPVRALCLLVALGGAATMLYSIAVEIPFRRAWLRRGHTEALVTTGTYALTRHPGVLWYSLTLFAWGVAVRSRRLLIAAPLLIAGDVAHVRFQERVVLTRLFGDAYREYQHRTPFVVPTTGSMRRFVQSVCHAEVATGAARWDAPA